MNLLGTESVFQLLDGLDSMPVEAFQHSEEDISNMIGTIMSDPMYMEALSTSFNRDPDLFLKEIWKLRKKIEDAKKFPEEKAKILTGMYKTMLEDAEQIVLCGGHFEEVEVKVLRLDDEVMLPEYNHPGDAGMDIHANEDAIIKPFERKVIKTGLQVVIPGGYEIQVRPRSGLALKKGLTVANTPGTIDAPYRKEIGIIAINLSDSEIEINKGDRIAQLVLNRVPHILWNEVDESTYERFATERGEGFGSSGV